MEREEPPPMSSEAEPAEVKKDIFDDDEDDELFRSAIDSKMGGGSIASTVVLDDRTAELEADGEAEDDTSGYLTSEVNRSNTFCIYQVYSIMEILD